MPKIFATKAGAVIAIGSIGRCTVDKGLSIPIDLAEEIEREIAGDPGCSKLDEPCAECKRGCDEHIEFRKEWNEKHPELAHLPHFNHVCTAPAHRGHVGVPGRTDVRIEWEKPKAAEDLPGPTPVAIHEEQAHEGQE